MNTDPIDEFQGGNDKQREHLNKLVKRINELCQAVDAIENWNIETVCVHDNENENIIRIEVKSANIIETVGVIDCDCVSGQSHGDA